MEKSAIETIALPRPAKPQFWKVQRKHKDFEAKHKDFEAKHKDFEAKHKDFRDIF